MCYPGVRVHARLSAPDRELCLQDRAKRASACYTAAGIYCGTLALSAVCYFRECPPPSLFSLALLPFRTQLCARHAPLCGPVWVHAYVGLCGLCRSMACACGGEGGWLSSAAVSQSSRAVHVSCRASKGRGGRGRVRSLLLCRPYITLVQRALVQRASLEHAEWSPSQSGKTVSLSLFRRERDSCYNSQPRGGLRGRDATRGMAQQIVHGSRHRPE